MHQCLKNILKSGLSVIINFFTGNQRGKAMRLEKRPSGDCRSGVIDLIFVHGLGGDPVDTWRSGEKFWPDWLSEEFDSIQIWTLGWPAKKFSWISSGEMTIQDRANSVLELLCNKGIGEKKLAFVCHSLGGILVKEALRSSATLNNPAWKKISANTVGIVFMGTPHTGSALANVLKLVPGASMKAAELQRNDGVLRSLNQWYRAYVFDSGTKTLTFFETKPVPKLNLLVVDQSSADPGVVDYPVPVAVGASHYDISKPSSNEDPIYLAVASFLKKLLTSPPSSKINLFGSGKITAFRESYLISETGCLPFGGRDAEMKLLDDWLADDAGPGRLLITGPTGRGKSALLVRWTDQVARSPSGNGWHIVFVPISMRFGTNRPSVFYSILATQLADILDSPLQAPVVDPEGFYSGVTSSMLQQLKGTTKKVLIVVDGIDEALNQRFDAMIFPLQLPPTIKIVLSAREQANDAGSMGWKRRLGWDTGVRVTSIELSTLKKPGIVDVLQSAGLSLNEIPNSIVDRVLELSQGEPLLVKLYAEDLSEIAKNKKRVGVKDLDGISPGFGAYFSRWIALQRQAWKDEGRVINDSAIDATLAVLACAFGPLQSEHLVSLVCKISKQPRPLSAEHFIKPLKRFIAGCGTINSGYVLNHPRLGQYLCEKYFDGAAISKMHLEFAAWGRTTVDLIKQENSTSIEVPPYLLQYYTQHLAAIQGTIDDYASLLSNGWRLAWEKFEGGYRGYSADIRSVLNRIGATEQYLPEIAHPLRIRFRAALCLSSVQSISSNFPPELLALALSEDILTPRQAIHYIVLQPPQYQRQFFVAISKHILEDQADNVIDAIYQTQEIGNRAKFLAQALKDIPKNRRDRLLADILERKSYIVNSLQRAGSMMGLVPQLSGNQLNDAYLEATSIPVTSANTTSFAILLGKFAECFEQIGDSQKAAEVLQRSLALLDSADDVFAKVDALSELAHILPKSTLQTYVDLWYPLVEERARDLPTKVQSGDFQINSQIERTLQSQAALMLLRAQRLTDSEYDKQVDEALKIVDVIDELHRVWFITSHLRFIRNESRHRIIQICLQMVRRLPTGNNRTHALVTLAKNTPKPLRTDIIREGLKNARLIEDDCSRGLTLAALFSQLSQDEKLSEFPIVMTEIKKIRYVLNRGEVFIKIASFWPMDAQQLFESGVDLISLALIDELRIFSKVNVVGKLPDSLKIKMFRQCFKRLLKGTDPFAWTVCAHLAEETADLWSNDDLEAAFRFSFKATNQFYKTMLLLALAPIATRFGRNDIIDVALSEIMAQQDKRSQVSGLAKIIPCVDSADKQRDLVSNALEMATGLPSPAEKAAALIEMLPVLSGKQREANWHLAKDAALQADNNWRLLKNLSVCCLEEDEKIRLIQAAFASAAKLPPTDILPAVIQLAPLLSTISEQLLALDLMTEQAGVQRSTLLGAIEQSASLLTTIGGTEFVRQLMHEIIDNANWWP